MKAVLKKATELVVPSEDEQKAVDGLVEDIIAKVSKASRIHRVKAGLMLGGSVGKGSWLPGVHDFDFFFRFDFDKYCGRTDEMSDITEKVLNKAFGNVSRVHGSRDYFQIHMGEKLVEVIPVIEIKKVKDAKNITDASPLHVTWIKKQLKAKKVTELDLRLAKQFFKANHSYGAESFIKGFSGHVIEILTCHYGSFEKLVKAMQKWKPGEIFDVQKHHKKADKALEALNPEKKKSPIIVIDPIEPTRNAAASLRGKVFNQMVTCSADFCKKPSINYFVEKATELKDLKKKETARRKLVAFKAAPDEGKLDVVGARLLKQYEHILSIFQQNDFTILGSDWYWPREGSALLYFYIDGKELSKTKILQGPQTFGTQEHILAFKSKYRRRKVWRQGYNYYAEVPRKVRKISDVLKLIKKDEEFANITFLK